MTSQLNDDVILSAVLAYWHRLRGERAMPSRREIDPIGLGAKVLPYVVLVDVVRGEHEPRYRFRLCGTAVADAAGLDLTGHYVDELNPNPDYARYIIGLYGRLLDVRRPLYSESAYLTPARNARRSTRRLMCPLSEDGVAVHHVLVGQTFVDVTRLDPPSMTYAETFQPGMEEVL